MQWSAKPKKGPECPYLEKTVNYNKKKDKRLTCKLFISPLFILISASFCAISVSSKFFSFPSPSMSLVIMSNSGFEYDALLVSYRTKSILSINITHH